MIWRIALLAAIIALLSSVPTIAGAADDGVIQGQVINQTEDGSSTADVAVSLKTYAHDGVEEGDPITVQTDADGIFEFDTLSTASDNIHQVTLTFLDVVYASDYIIFATDETSKTVDINVYDTTDSDALIFLVQSSTVVYTEPETEDSPLLVIESYMIANTTLNTVYIGADDGPVEGSKEVLRFTVPAGATGLTYGAGLTDGFVFETDDGFITTMPIKPGHPETIKYSYYLAPSENTLDISRKFHYPLVGSHALMVQDTGSIKVSTDQLTSKESVVNDGSTFFRYEGTEFPADTIVTASINLAATSSQAAVIWWIAGSVLAAAAAGGATYWKKKKSARSATIQIATPNTTENIRQKLFVEIARLDDDLEAGKISKEQHHILRSEKKTQLIKLMRRPKVKTDGA